MAHDPNDEWARLQNIRDEAARKLEEFSSRPIQDREKATAAFLVTLSEIALALKGLDEKGIANYPHE